MTSTELLKLHFIFELSLCHSVSVSLSRSLSLSLSLCLSLSLLIYSARWTKYVLRRLVKFKRPVHLWCKFEVFFVWIIVLGYAFCVCIYCTWIIYNIPLYIYVNPVEFSSKWEVFKNSCISLIWRDFGPWCAFFFFLHLFLCLLLILVKLKTKLMLVCWFSALLHLFVLVG